MRALIVDDSPALRAMLSRVLRHLGFEVVEAVNGRAALAVLESAGEVTVALVDWNMPVMNGVEFVRALREDSKRSGVRVIMVTSEASAERATAAFGAGADAFLTKPFSVDVLRAQLVALGIPLE